MQDKVYAAIKGWAGIFTWHTSHPLDEARFYEAVTNLRYEVGTEVTEHDIREALRQHRTENPTGLGGKPSDDKLEGYVVKIMAELARLENGLPT